MTLHSPTTEGADRETGSLVGAVHHQTTPQSGRPMMGVILDALVACFKGMYRAGSASDSVTEKYDSHSIAVASFVCFLSRYQQQALCSLCLLSLSLSFLFGIFRDITGYLDGPRFGLSLLSRYFRHGSPVHPRGRSLEELEESLSDIARKVH
jgi:hypothetical protein